MVPFFESSINNKYVIRKPLITKKIVTPTAPCLAISAYFLGNPTANRLCAIKTNIIDIALNPSNEGILFNFFL